MNKMRNSRKDIIINDEDIDAIIFRNFSGNADKFNKQGAMPNFTLVVPGDVASYLSDEGLEIKEVENYDGEKEYRVKIWVRFDNFPPEVYKVCGRKKMLLDADTVGDLDRADIEHIDITISPYHYETPNRKGVKAYLKVGFFTIADNPFADKYDFDDEDDDMPFGE